MGGSGWWEKRGPEMHHSFLLEGSVQCLGILLTVRFQGSQLKCLVSAGVGKNGSVMPAFLEQNSLSKGTLLLGSPLYEVDKC